VEPLPISFGRTREAAHALAEHVLCTVRYAAVGRIGLTPVPDGIVTPTFDDRVVGLRGLDLVDAGPGVERRTPVTTLRAAGQFFGVEPVAPPLWTPSTTPDLDAPLDIDADGAAVLAAWFALVAGALTQVDPTAAQTLWPEHFDLAITVGEVTYGGSPGDAEHPEPYLYVLPPAGFERGDPRFWNEPFGASLPHHRIAGREDADAFFTEAKARLGAADPRAPSS
jgi:hypothetical protein